MCASLFGQTSAFITWQLISAWAALSGQSPTPARVAPLARGIDGESRVPSDNLFDMMN
jgi:hypothetical protein